MSRKRKRDRRVRWYRWWTVALFGLCCGWSLVARLWIGEPWMTSNVLRAVFGRLPVLIYPFACISFWFPWQVIRRRAGFGDMMLAACVWLSCGHVLWADQ